MSKPLATQILDDEKRESKLPSWARAELRHLRQENRALQETLEQIAGKQTNVEFGHPIIGNRHGYLPDNLPIKFNLDDMGNIELQLQDRFGDVPVVRLHAHSAYHFEFIAKPVSGNALDLTFAPRTYETRLPKRDA